MAPEEPSHDRWALLRFAVVGPLLAAPPAEGELKEELERLSEKAWEHPTRADLVKFAVSTIERWYYTARGDDDPVGVLRRKPREDRGRQRSISVKLAEAIRCQYKDHRTWSYRLHYDNLKERAKEEPEFGPVPSYATVRRYMISNGLKKRTRRKGRKLRPGELEARRRQESREKRGYEAEYVAGLWHLDFHECSRTILTASGEWIRPALLGILDDRSRLVCHAQWYRQEETESLTHGFVQALCKRGLPRSLMSDNGGAMLAAEFTEGLAGLSISHDTTLPYSPHQNGKQESFWGQVEGRLVAMLEGKPDVTLQLLNTSTLAWVELEYHRRVHSETGQTPLDRWLAGPTVARRCPGLDELRLAFTTKQTRTQRGSDGTISVAGTRFEVPSRFRHMRKIPIRYARWDLSHVWLMDPHRRVALDRLYPVDKVRNAEGHRRPLKPLDSDDAPPPVGIAPVLRRLLSEYAATGMPPAYVPQEDS